MPSSSSYTPESPLGEDPSPKSGWTIVDGSSKNEMQDGKTDDGKVESVSNVEEDGVLILGDFDIEVIPESSAKSKTNQGKMKEDAMSILNGKSFSSLVQVNLSDLY